MSDKVVSFAELKKHTAKNDLYLLIAGKVYDATKFIDEHPGGDEVLLAEAGQDATEGFEDVGHSDEAREMLKPLFVGNFDKNSGLDLKSGAAAAQATRAAGAVESGSNIAYFVPLALLGAYFGWRYYSTGSV